MICPPPPPPPLPHPDSINRLVQVEVEILYNSENAQVPDIY